jgi:hypothetical protein
MAVLERLRDKLRDLGYVPMVFNFDKPETKDFTETVRLLCGLSHFVIVDLTNPRSAPLELQATVPDYMVPFAPILEDGEQPFSMFVDLHIKYDWVLQPVIGHPSIDRLIEVLEEKIVNPAEAKFNELLVRRTKQLRAVGSCGPSSADRAGRSRAGVAWHGYSAGGGASEGGLTPRTS